MNRIKISVPSKGRIITMDTKGPMVTPTYVTLDMAEAILREGHKVHYHKVDNTSEELTLDILYVLMEKEGLSPSTVSPKGELKVISVLERMGVDMSSKVDSRGSFNGRHGLMTILSQHGAVKDVDSISGVDNILDTLADWGFSRARLDSEVSGGDGDDYQPPTDMTKVILVLSSAFDMPITAFNLSEFSSPSVLPNALTLAEANVNGALQACHQFYNGSYSYDAWVHNDVLMGDLYAANIDKVYVLGNSDHTALKNEYDTWNMENFNNDVYVIGAEDTDIARWVAYSGRTPEYDNGDNPTFMGASILVAPPLTDEDIPK